MSKGLLMRWSWTLFPLVPLQLFSGPPSAFPVSAKMGAFGFHDLLDGGRLKQVTGSVAGRCVAPAWFHRS